MAYDNTHVWETYHVLTPAQMTQVSDNIAWLHDNLPYPISTQVLSGSPAYVEFATIQSSWNHLKIMFQARSAKAQNNEDLRLTFNGDTGNNYEGLGGVISHGGALSYAGLVTSAYFPVGNIPAGSTTANFAGCGEIIIPNYKNTVFFKNAYSKGFATFPSEATGNQWETFYGGMWESTAAITTVRITLGSGGNFVTGSIFSLGGFL